MKHINRLTKIVILIILINILLAFSFVSNASSEITTYSPHVLLLEASTGKIIYEKGANDRVYPASTTKIMTAILALENCQLTDVVTASYDAIYSVPVGYAHAYIKVDEELTINQLLHVLLIPSANDAANILAEHIAGSITSFASMMNTRAVELGCTDTNFVNPSGIHDTNHYSSAHDLAIIGRYAMQNETFRKIVSTTEYTLPNTNKYEGVDRYFKTTNSLIAVDTKDRVDNYYYSYATGIKTGYTVAAGNCVVSSAKKDSVEYIVVILGAETTDNGLSARYLDCKKLFEYAFENYSLFEIYKKDDILKQIEVSTGTFMSANLNLVIENDITIIANKDTKTSNLIPEVNITSDLALPIVKNSVIGTITYNVDGNEYSSVLLAGNDIIESNLISYILVIGSVIIVLFLMMKLVKYNKKKKRKKRRQY